MVLTLLLFCPLISALVFPGPLPTAVENAAKIQPWTPRPTEGPDLKELLKRQDLSYTIIEGPDSICGYQFGSSDYGLGLCGTSTCGFATAIDQTGYIYCFSSTTTEYRPTWTSCMVGTEATSCLGNPACSGNPNIIQCTRSTAAYCNVGTFIGLGVEAVWCDSTGHAGSMVPVSTTYVGQINRALTTVEETTTTTSTPKSTTSTPNPSTTPSPLPSTSPGPTPTPTPTPTPKPTPVGAIVGGVVGGLAVIAAIIAGILLCLRRNRQNGQNTPKKEIAESPAQPQNPYNPNTNAQAEKYPAPAGYVSPVVVPTSPNPEQQQYHHVQPQAQYPPEKNPTAAGGAFTPAQYATASSPNPEQQQRQQYQAPPAQQQPQQYQAPPTHNQAIPMQASQPVYQPPQQVPAAPRFTEQQSVPITQTTYYSAPQGAPNFQVQQPVASEIHRESTVSTVSAPASPAPPYTKPTMMTGVQEMSGEYNGRTEMSGESHHVVSYPEGRNEMSGESAPHPFTTY